MKNNSDKSAFPINEENGEATGLTKREYFAGLAPDNIPDWFEHTKDEDKPERPLSWVDIKEGHKFFPFKDELKNWTHDPCYDLPPSLKWYQDAHEKYNEQKLQYDNNNKSDRYFQWRTFYADKLLQQLDNPQHPQS